MTLNFPAPLTEKHCAQSVDEFIGTRKPKKILQAFIREPFDSAWLFVRGKSTWIPANE